MSNLVKLGYFIELESKGLGKVVDVKYSDGFFKYIYDNYPWELTGSSIDWRNVDAAVSIDCTNSSEKEIDDIFLKSPLSKYKHVCLFFYPDEPGFLCSFEFAREYLWSLLNGPGEGYMVGVNEQSNHIELLDKSDFVEIYAGDWISWGNLEHSLNTL
jgi:hypothetical protein